MCLEQSSYLVVSVNLIASCKKWAFETSWMDLKPLFFGDSKRWRQVYTTGRRICTLCVEIVLFPTGPNITETVSKFRLRNFQKDHFFRLVWFINRSNSKSGPGNPIVCSNNALFCFVSLIVVGSLSRQSSSCISQITNHKIGVVLEEKVRRHVQELMVF